MEGLDWEEVDFEIGTGSTIDDLNFSTEKKGQRAARFLNAHPVRPVAYPVVRLKSAVQTASYRISAS